MTTNFELVSVSTSNSLSLPEFLRNLSHGVEGQRHIRRPVLRYIVVAVWGCLLTHSMHAQVAGPQANYLRFAFDRQNNSTYTTRFDLHRQQITPRYEFDLYVHHDHLINTSRSEQPFVQLLVNGYFWQHWRLAEQWALSSWLETDQFWNTNTQRHSIYLGVRYRPLPGLEITPLVGYSWDYRQEMLDQGLSPALRVRSQYDFGDGLMMQTRALVRTKYIQPRHQRNVRFLSEWVKTFDEHTALSLSLQGGSNQMDDYQSQSIERIKSDTVGAALQWQYPLPMGLIWQADNRISRTQRRFAYDPFGQPNAEFNDLRFTQTDFSTRQELSLGHRRWNGRLIFDYHSLDRGYDLANSLAIPDIQFRRLLDQEREKDFFRRVSTFDLSVNYRPDPRHRLTLTTNNRYLRYDTPSEENFDDHDELTYGAGLTWQADWARRFMTRYRLIGSRRQYAFLFGERSQDNYTQRNLRADFAFRWDILDNLSFDGSQAVYVNYNVKDFEDLNRTDRSTRNLETRLALTYRPKRSLDVTTSFYRKETHVSYLNWEQFAETPLDTMVIYIIETKAQWTLGKSRRYRWRVDGGYRHFSQFRYLNTAMLSRESILTPINLGILTYQTGPTTGVKLLTRRKGSLEASVWWQWQIQGFQYDEIAQFTTLSSNYQQEVLDRTEVALRPFLHLSVNMNL